MKSKISYRIRKLRESKDLSQENVAADLNLTSSAYSKIERGVTDPSVGRLEQIAKILGVEVTYFFQESNEQHRVEEGPALYGFATKIDIDEVNNAIKQLKQEIAVLKKELAAIHTRPAKSKK